MKDHEIRIAIAESCGWTECRYVEGLRDCHGVPPLDYPGDPIPDSNRCWLPRYTRDLNAMWQAEEMLGIEFGLFELELRGGVHATAAQRAEAYLRAKELWKEEE